MSQTEAPDPTGVAQPEEAVVPAEELDSVGAAVRGYIERLKAGDVGSLPVVLGVVVIGIIFNFKTSSFLTANNFNNLIVQMAGTAVIAIGVVFILLLGEIDLSIGYVSGVCGVMVAWLQEPGTSHQLPGLVAIVIAVLFGALIGAFQGSFVALIGVPSFVVTLAGLLAWQGVIIKWIGQQGVIGIQDTYINDVANYALHPKYLGWILALIVIVAMAGSTAGDFYTRHRAGLPLRNVQLAALKVIGVAAATLIVVKICNDARGVPLAGVILVALLAIWTFIAKRTTFGRHVYAVGGNAEAAHRSGINVRFIRIAVFAISGGMAAIGGIFFASRLNSVDLTAGGGSILLDSIAAAVIGGTSLFGGRGRVVSALLGALVISTIANGLSLIGSSSATEYIVTGIILLAAVVLDTVSRRRLAASGR
jgi:D-xylose transport system permease protein